jgi:hypothetical protein
LPPPFLVPMTAVKFPAVTVACGVNHCAAVDAVEGQRMLATQAPRLPFPNCSMPAKCRCRFKKYVDRREDDEGRRFRFRAEISAWYAGKQRRQSTGRRSSD